MLVLTCGCAKRCCPCERNALRGRIRIGSGLPSRIRRAVLQKLECKCGGFWSWCCCLTGSHMQGMLSASDERVWLGSTSLSQDRFWILCSLLRLACEVPNNSELASNPGGRWPEKRRPSLPFLVWGQLEYGGMPESWTKAGFANGWQHGDQMWACCPRSPLGF